MNRLFKEAMPATFSELKRDERHDLIGKLCGACDDLVELSSLVKSVEAQDRIREIAVRLTSTVHVLKVAVDTMHVRYTDNACAMSGLLDMLDKMGEKELNSIHLLTLLQPHHEYLRKTHNMFSECLVG